MEEEFIGQHHNSDFLKVLTRIAVALEKLSDEDELEVAYAGLKRHVNKLKRLGRTNRALSSEQEGIMAAPTLQDFKDLLAQADTETNRIAQRITDLMNAVQPGMSEADVQTIKDGLQAEVDKLKGVGVVSGQP